MKAIINGFMMVETRRTNMTTYMICDGDGNALTDGVQEHEADRIAQNIANRRGQSVWLSPSDSDDIGTEFEPEARE
jgi:hypothetical protein